LIRSFRKARREDASGEQTAEKEHRRQKLGDAAEGADAENKWGSAGLSTYRRGFFLASGEAFRQTWKRIWAITPCRRGN
jgi:hypothetical protein